MFIVWYRPMMEIADSSDLCEEEYKPEEEDESMKTQAWNICFMNFRNTRK